MGDRQGVEWVDAGVWAEDLKGKMAPKPGTLGTDDRYWFDNRGTGGGVVNPGNKGPMTCDICGQKGHGKAECGASYTGQPEEFEKNGKTYITWQYLNKRRLCNGRGRKPYKP